MDTDPFTLSKGTIGGGVALMAPSIGGSRKPAAPAPATGAMA